MTQFGGGLAILMQSPAIDVWTLADSRNGRAAGGRRWCWVVAIDLWEPAATTTSNNSGQHAAVAKFCRWLPTTILPVASATGGSSPLLSCAGLVSRLLELVLQLFLTWLGMA
eukprot:m.159748 g.159748  ORF g.159748 m.159748 type:complete len:112 (+) comp17611_c0_seq1:494-829(+)